MALTKEAPAEGRIDAASEARDGGVWGRPWVLVALVAESSSRGASCRNPA